MEKAKVAKKDIYVEDPVEGSSTTVRRLVARKGQVVPRGFEDQVKDSDVTTEQARTRSLIAGRATSARVAAAGDREELSHEEAREAAAEVPSEDAYDEEAKSRDEAEGDKARRTSRNKARKGANKK